MDEKAIFSGSARAAIISAVLFLAAAFTGQYGFPANNAVAQSTTATSTTTSLPVTTSEELLSRAGKQFEPNITLNLSDSTLSNTFRLISEQSSESEIVLEIGDSIKDLDQDKRSYTFKKTPFWQVVKTMVEESDWQIGSKRQYIGKPVEFTLEKSIYMERAYFYKSPMLMMLGLKKSDAGNRPVRNDQKTDVPYDVLVVGIYNHPEVIQYYKEPFVYMKDKAGKKIPLQDAPQRFSFYNDGCRELEYLPEKNRPDLEPKVYIDLAIRVLQDRHTIILPPKVGKYTDEASGLNVEIKSFELDGIKASYECSIGPRTSLTGDTKKRFNDVVSELLEKAKSGRLTPQEKKKYEDEMENVFITNNANLYYMLDYHIAVDANGNPLPTGLKESMKMEADDITISRRFEIEEDDAGKLHLAFKIGKYMFAPLTIELPMIGQSQTQPATSPSDKQKSQQNQ